MARKYGRRYKRKRKNAGIKKLSKVPDTYKGQYIQVGRTKYVWVKPHTIKRFGKTIKVKGYYRKMLGHSKY